ncbi:10492_t:CDS:2 [Gigaspora margarita]|uniref:10492_t:CDS:1 n=1 Tax=Gigaspora margarita TaxID=4874 RepID=A0ABM8VWP6_GIGMA|nr:10492_t:CDS:2 [Gigaspora margarita]
MGDIPVYTQTIYLNELFLHKQMGLQVFFERHAILTNTNPKSQEINDGHGKEHDKLIDELKELLKTFPEHQELKRH